MFCSNCGTKIDGNSSFCRGCGMQLMSYENSTQSDTPKKKKTGWIALIILLVVLIVLSVVFIAFFLIYQRNETSESKKQETVIEKSATTDTGKITQEKMFEGSGFDSPKEAITAYLEAFRDADVDRMLSTFAVESYVENYDLVKNIERMAAFMPSAEQMLPANSEFAKDINLHKRVYFITNGIYYQYMTITQPDSHIVEGLTLTLEEDEIESYVDEMGNLEHLDKLGTLEIGDYIEMESLESTVLETEQKENIKKQLDKRKLIYGVDEIRSDCMKVKIDGKEYVFFMEMALYNGKWYNLNFSGYLGSVLGLTSNCYGFGEAEYVGIDEQSSYDAYIEESRESADKDLLDSVYAACCVAASDPEITQLPPLGEMVSDEVFQSTDWGRAVFDTLGVTSVSDVEQKLKSKKAGNHIEIYCESDGGFTVTAGDISVPD